MEKCPMFSACHINTGSDPQKWISREAKRKIEELVCCMGQKISQKRMRKLSYYRKP